MGIRLGNLVSTSHLALAENSDCADLPAPGAPARSSWNEPIDVHLGQFAPSRSNAYTAVASAQVWTWMSMCCLWTISSTCTIK